MNKLTLAIAILCLASAAVFAQNDRSTRARVVPSSTPQSAPTDGDLNTGTSGIGKRPVLVNPNRPTAQATPTPIVEDDDDDEIIRVETNIVTMPVSVLDRDGRFIGGLSQRDFKIFEDGIEQKVEYFQSVEQPFTVVLLIDVSPSTAFRIDEIHNSAIAFVDQLRPGDRVSVVAFDEYVRVLCPPTSDRNQIRNAIRQAQIGNGTSLFEAVHQVLVEQFRRIDGRKAVVLFSDGVDTTSRRSSYQSTIRETEESEALVYSIRYDTSGDGFGGRRRPPMGPRTGRTPTMGDILASIILGGTINTGPGGGGRGSSNSEYEDGKRYLETIAQNSGGRSFEADSIYDLDAAFSGIAEELRRQYSIGYYPEKAGNVGDRRQIRVRVMRPNVVVRAKNSYIVGQTTRSLAGK